MNTELWPVNHRENTTWGSRRGREDIKICPTEIGYRGEDLIEVAHEGAPLRSLVNTVLILRLLFLTVWVTGKLHHDVSNRLRSTSFHHLGLSHLL